MKKITQILDEKKFTYSAELVTPRNGTDPEDIRSKIRRLKGTVDFVSVTQGAGGSLRGGTLPLSIFAQEHQGINTIQHFVCRERTKYEIENDLMDMSYCNIRNVLAIRGDAPADAKNETWDGDYKYAYFLANQLKELNQGHYLPRKNVDEGDFRIGMKTDFCILVAGHPEDPIEEEIMHMKKKVKSGAEVIITQMIFSFDEYKNYVESLRKAGVMIPVIAGIRPLISEKQARGVENFFGLKVDEELMNGLKSAKTDIKAKEFGLQYTEDLINKLKGFGTPGVHLFILNDVGLVEELIEKMEAIPTTH